MSSEYTFNIKGYLILPYKCIERMKNEVAAIRYIQSHTTIPTPNIRCAFEDHGRYYIVTDIVPGVTLAELPANKKAPVIKELEGYRAQMHAIKSKVMGGLLGDMILPCRLSCKAPEHHETFREAETPEFVLCHNDLSQHNVLVDETSLKINAIIDWEYAGFLPPSWPFRSVKRRRRQIVRGPRALESIKVANPDNCMVSVSVELFISTLGLCFCLFECEPYCMAAEPGTVTAQRSFATSGLSRRVLSYPCSTQPMPV